MSGRPAIAPGAAALLAVATLGCAGCVSAPAAGPDDPAAELVITQLPGAADPAAAWQRGALEQRHPAHLSPRYNMVMFSTMPYSEAQARASRQAELIGRALADPTTDIDALVAALPPLPALDPLADPDALSVS